jgi:hypothetical protein
MRDSFVVPHFLKGAAPAYEALGGELTFAGPAEIWARSRKVRPFSRRKAYSIEVATTGRLAGLEPVYYGYTGDVAGHVRVTHLRRGRTPLHDALLTALQRYEPRLNHGITTSYGDETQSMPAHADKTESLVAGSFIFNYTVYADPRDPPRQLVFRAAPAKKPATAGAAAEEATAEKSERKTSRRVPPAAVLHTETKQHDDLYVMGPQDNAATTHELPALTEPSGPCASFIARAASHYLTPRGVRAYQQRDATLQRQHLDTLAREAEAAADAYAEAAAESEAAAAAPGMKRKKPSTSTSSSSSSSSPSSASGVGVPKPKTPPTAVVASRVRVRAAPAAV